MPTAGNRFPFFKAMHKSARRAVKAVFPPALAAEPRFREAVARQAGRLAAQGAKAILMV